MVVLSCLVEEAAALGLFCSSWVRQVRVPPPRLALDSALGGDAALGGILAKFEDDGLLPPLPTSADATFRSDFHTGEDLARCCRKWPGLMSEDLPDLKCTIEQATSSGPGVAIVRWNATWTPSSLLWLDTLGSLWPGVEVCPYTILEKYNQEARFSWEALFKLFGTALSEGKLYLPISAVRGSSTIEYDAADLRVRRLREEYEIVALFDAKAVRNRRITRDFLEFMNARVPGGVDELDWDAEIRKRCDVASVPGMGQFDIDGLDDAKRSKAYDVAAVGFGAASAFVLAVGVLLSGYVLQGEGFLGGGPAGSGKDMDYYGKTTRMPRRGTSYNEYRYADD